MPKTTNKKQHIVDRTIELLMTMGEMDVTFVQEELRKMPGWTCSTYNDIITKLTYAGYQIYEDFGKIGLLKKEVVRCMLSEQTQRRAYGELSDD